MRVLIVDKTGGLETAQERFRQIVEADKGMELHVLVPRKWKEHGLPVDATAIEPEGYQLHLGRVLWKGYYARGFYLTGLFRALWRSKPDVIHLLEEPWSFFAWQVARAARLFCPRSKIIFYSWENIYRNFTYPSRISFIQRRIDKRLHRRSVGAVCATEQARSVLEIKGFKGPVEVIPYGVDTPFLANPIEPALSRSPDEFRIGYIGRFLKMKGLDILIEAAARVQGAQLLMIREGEYEEGMRTLISRKGISDRVQMLSPIPRESVPGYLASMDVLVLPSRTTDGWMEQLGRVMLEAMAVGVPVIGSESGAIPEVLDDAGMIYPEDSPGSLAQCIERLRQDPELRREMIDRGRRRVQERFNWRLFARESVRLYRQVLEISEDDKA